MADLDKATATQLANIEQRTGQRIPELVALVRDSGLAKHGEMVAMLKTTLGMGHGDANLVVHLARQPEDGAGAGTAAATGDDPLDALDALYVGPKAALRPIHERALEAMRAFGDFEAAPKKTYVSYRRTKQFAMIGPATKSQVEIGINAKGLEAGERLQAMPAGGMCQYRVRLDDAAGVDAELVGWLRAAYDAAG